MEIPKSPDPFLTALCLTRHQTFPTHPPLSLLYIPDSFPPPETLMNALQAAIQSNNSTLSPSPNIPSLYPLRNTPSNPSANRLGRLPIQYRYIHSSRPMPPYPTLRADFTRVPFDRILLATE